MAILNTVLLCALPASGKSETRKVLRSFSAEDCEKTFRIGKTVDLDDYPYVHFMRVVDDFCEELGVPRIFFAAADKGFIHTEDWITLMHLINEDYHDVVTHAKQPAVESAADWLFARMDAAREKAGIHDFIRSCPNLQGLREKCEKEARGILEEKYRLIPDSLEGRTIVIEFARGGPDGSSFPLPYPLGYQASLAALSDEVLDKAVMLYVKVTPEQSRAKNYARSHESAGDPTNPHLSLNHGVPLSVMLNDYGVCDHGYLMELAKQEGVDNALLVRKGDRKVFVPIALFDNTDDYTTFARGPQAQWPADKLQAFRNELVSAFNRAHEAYDRLHK